MASSSPPPWNSTSSRLRSAILLAAIVIAGLLLRMAPWFQDPGLELTSDAAYNERLVDTWVQNGSRPSPDALSEPSQGRRLERLLPEGMYVAATLVCRVAGVRDDEGVRLVLLWLTAAAGALIALPVWLAARALWQDDIGALVGAAIATFLPAHVHRTVCYWVRYDALGTLLIATHLAFALRALDPSNHRRLLDAALSALGIAAALAVWRVALVVPLLEAGFVAVWTVWRGGSPALHVWFTIETATATVTMLVVSYLRAQGFALSPSWLAVIGITAASWAPAKGARKAPLMFGGAALGLVVGLVLARSSPYAVSVDMTWLKLRTLLHLGGGTPVGMTALLLQVEELYGLTPAGLLFGPQQFLAIGVWLVAAPFVLRRLGPRAQPNDSTARWFLGFLTLAFALLTLLMVRSKVLLAPLAAIVCGGLWTALWTRSPSQGARGAASAARRWLAILFALSALATIICGVMLGLSRASRLDPGLATCLRWLKAHAAPGTIVLGSAFSGYDIERYTGCASLTDGLLESVPNQERILQSYSAWVAHGDSPLVDLCRRNRVAFVLVPPPSDLLYFAEVTGASFRARLESGSRLETSDLDRPIVRMMLGEMSGPFEQVAEAEGRRLYRVVPSIVH